MRSMTWFVAAAALLLLLAGNVTPTLAETFYFAKKGGLVGPPEDSFYYVGSVLVVSGGDTASAPDGYTRVTLDELRAMGLPTPDELSEGAEGSGTAGPEGEGGGPDWLAAEFETLLENSCLTEWGDTDDPMKSIVSCSKAHPFSSSIRISLRAEVPGSLPAPLRIYDVQGRLVRTLIVNRESQAVWDGRDHGGGLLPSGTYVVCCDFAGSQATGRVILQR
jgi:hypothetical protein